jgi:hypothetical protein
LFWSYHNAGVGEKNPTPVFVVFCGLKDQLE